MTAAEPMARIQACPLCGSRQLVPRDVLWQGLIDAWELSPEELGYLNRQQGLHCTACGNNLRMMALGAALVRWSGFDGTLAQFCDSGSDLRILEVNTAGFLTQFLERMPGHRLVAFPEFDMMALAIDSDEYDLVIHSDSLEHVEEPVKALSECRRVLRDGGCCIFTVPIVVGRLTRSRAGLPPSYHGNAGEEPADQIVRTEYGADAWRHVIEAGFASCEIVALEYPAALSLVARK